MQYNHLVNSIATVASIYYIRLLQVVKLTNLSKLKQTQIKHFPKKSMTKIFRGNSSVPKTINTHYECGIKDNK